MEKMTIEPGIYPDMSNEDYHQGPGISKSGLDLVARSPYLYRYSPPREQTKAMLIGSAFHAMTLEPDLFGSLFAVRPSGIDSRTKAGKEALAEFAESNAGKTVFDPDDAAKVEAMANAVRSNQAAANLLADGEAETSIFHIDEHTDELVKVRPDWMVEDLLVDLKSTEDASHEAFARSCWNYRYFVQAAFYLDVANAQLGFKRFSSFCFIACEKSPPYQVAVYVADQQMVEAGRAEYRRCLNLYHQCRVADTWPGINDGRIVPIGLPGWALRQIETAITD